MNATAEAVTRLRVTEIFHSLQGEARFSGLPTVFVRLTGCPLRCRYCDTAYAFSGGTLMSLEEIRARVAAWPARHVTVTGGEPLAQKGCLALMRSLCDAGYVVSLETSGALDLSRVDPRVIKVMDLKTPGSGEAGRNLYANLEHLSPQDQVKFVICDEHDYQWMKDMVARHALVERCEVLAMPSHDELPAARLAEWILADGLPVRLQIQLHKYLWGDQPGR
ncbi:MAG TPA: 7-carboxy-7-deazaguanine synthase QueE [Gammaproteobacteria bacterium]|nr:7-carboxy-7-deazaguanine synthase QueE [Gammaproteobacteria bacterium]